MGEGNYNKVSTFELLHRVTDYFILSCLPGERDSEEPRPTSPRQEPPSYQLINSENAITEKLFVCAESSIQNLVDIIQSHDVKCGKPVHFKIDNMLQHVCQGTLKCTCDDLPHEIGWVSSPHLINGKFLANVRLGHAYFSCGILPNQYQKFCDAANFGILGEKYIKVLQEEYSAVVKKAANESIQEALHEEIAATAVTVVTAEEIHDGIGIVTDARHCWRKNAKFSDVVCLGDQTHKILNIQTVSRADDPSSQRHELIGVKKIYEYFDNQDCPVKYHAHDRNNSVSKFVTDERAPTENALDTWHMTKNLAKQAKKITKGKKMEIGKTWHPELADKAASIKTHIFWCMKNCQGNATKLRKSILNLVKHYQGIHTHCFQTSRCQQIRDDLSPYEPSKYLIKEKEAAEILIKFLKKLTVYKKAKEFRFCSDTHYVESFNNFLLQYHDKRIVFGENSYHLRVNLALLDWNENVDRPFTSIKYIEDATNPRRQSGVPVRKAKTTDFKNKLFYSWIQNIYRQ